MRVLQNSAGPQDDRMPLYSEVFLIDSHLLLVDPRDAPGKTAELQRKVLLRLCTDRDPPRSYP